MSLHEQEAPKFSKRHFEMTIKLKSDECSSIAVFDPRHIDALMLENRKAVKTRDLNYLAKRVEELCLCILLESSSLA